MSSIRTSVGSDDENPGRRAKMNGSSVHGEDALSWRESSGWDPISMEE